MIKINFETDKLVILNYPNGAGGKFIGLCLGIHTQFLPQEKKLARLKMKDQQDNNFGFNIAKKTFDTKHSTQSHFEFGCVQLAGFNSNHLIEDIKADEKMGNELWGELTTQDDFYFMMTEHDDNDIFRRYSYRKKIYLKNYQWILDSRDIGENNNQKNTNDTFSFDMTSVKDKNHFKSEIVKTYQFLDLELEHDSHLDELRKMFLDTLTIGFKQGGNNEGR